MPKSSTLAVWMLPTATLAMVVAVYAAFVAPIDTGEGVVQKILYVHVPVIWTAYLAFFVGLVASIGFLKNRKRSWDRVAACSTEVGVVFCTLILVTGPIWAKPIWNTWWQWDARLSATLVLWFMYVGYLAVRVLAEDRAQAARWSAVVSIVAFLDVPIVHKSVEWWHTLHPKPKALSPDGLNSGLDEGMGTALWLGVLAFTLLYLTLFFLRLTVERLSDERDEKRVAA